jgi:parallel beta-helix repeat protein
MAMDFVFKEDGNDCDDNFGSTNNSHYPLHEQEWLADDLAEHSNERTFVFTHSAGSSGWSEVRNIMENAGNVVAVFYGHSHGNAYSKEIGIRYYNLSAMANHDASQDPNVSCFALIEIDANGLFTLTGYGEDALENPVDWEETSFQLKISPIGNCIIWNNGEDLYDCNAIYSCIKDGDSGTGNIDDDPCFVDEGTNDFHLGQNSLCMDAGYETLVLDSVDIDGDPRLLGPEVDMGADEIRKVHNLTQDKWYGYIQDAIDDANNGDVIEALKGYYFETIGFGGKAVTLRSTDPNDWDVVETTIIDADFSSYGVYFNSNEDSNSILRGFTVRNATTGIFCYNTSPCIKNCIFEDCQVGARSQLNSPTIVNNKVRNCGLGIFILDSSPQIKSNWIYANTSAINCTDTDANAEIINNTIVDNYSYGIILASGSSPTITNCIIWDCNDDLYDCNATYSCIEDSNSGTGNISSDPNFVDDANDDYHLDCDSPCFDAGDPNGSYDDETDIDNASRRTNINGEIEASSIVDMGADEACHPVYNTTWGIYYDTINEAIGDANNGDDIEAATGTYNESVNFDGKSITLRSLDPNDWDVVEETIIQSSICVSFENGEDVNAVLNGFKILNSAIGVSCSDSSPTITNCIIEGEASGSCGVMIFSVFSSSSPLIKNNIIHQSGSYGIHLMGAGEPVIQNNMIYNNSDCGIQFWANTDSPIVHNNTIVGNDYGIAVVYDGNEPVISNCILWDNDVNDLYDCSATYSCIQDCNEADGTGNICGDGNDPLFVDDANDNYHLDPNSPCIDTGDPNITDTNELDVDFQCRVTDGDGDTNDVVDMGADEFPEVCQTCKGDLNGDGWIMLADMYMLSGILTAAGEPYQIPNTSPLYKDCGDMNGDRWIMLADLSILTAMLNAAGPPYQIQCE